jgi:hypothetical protein
MTPDQYEAAVSVLELECRLMRARMDRLEDENRRLEEEVVQLRIKLHNATQAPPVKSYCGGKPNYCTEPEDWVKPKEQK